MGQTHGKENLTPEEFDRLVRTTGFSNAEVNDFHEKFKNSFPKGFVDRKGFAKIYTSMFPHGSGADKLADHVFRTYDIDGNGKMSFKEFVMTLNVSAQGSVEDKLRSSFRMFDVDKNGYIKQKELTEILCAIYKTKKEHHHHAAKRAKKDAEEVMFALDTDKNKKLSETEFIQAARGNQDILRILEGV